MSNKAGYKLFLLKYTDLAHKSHCCNRWCDWAILLMAHLSVCLEQNIWTALANLDVHASQMINPFLNTLEISQISPLWAKYSVCLALNKEDVSCQMYRIVLGGRQNQVICCWAWRRVLRLWAGLIWWLVLWMILNVQFCLRRFEYLKYLIYYLNRRVYLSNHEIVCLWGGWIKFLCISWIAVMSDFSFTLTKIRPNLQ